MTTKKHTAPGAPKKTYQVLPQFTVHLGRSIYKAGSIVQLADAEHAIHAIRVEPYPVPKEVLTARAAQNAPDNAPRRYIVREQFVVWRGEEMHAAGSVLSLTPAEATKHAHAIEPLDNFTPPAPPAPEDLTTRPFMVRGGFHAQWKGEVRPAGSVLHMTASEAHAYAHMVEPAPAKAARAA